MGHEIISMQSDFTVRLENFDTALKAIQALAGKETITKQNFPGITDNDHFSFVNTEDFVKASDFPEAMKAWRWLLDTDNNGNAIDPTFVGENLGDEDILFETIAPYVEDNSFIQVFNVDEEVAWRWVFKKGKVKRKYGKIVF